MTNENILPDAISPQAHDRNHGRSESYWSERNALVDAVKACPLPTGARLWVAHSEHTAVEQDQWIVYRAALAAVKAFDAANGGTPIL